MFKKIISIILQLFIILTEKTPSSKRSEGGGSSICMTKVVNGYKHSM
ncbi:hypothetical protein [Bacillus cereus]